MSDSNFVDYVKICCRSGKGGAGSTHFYRDKLTAKGGPDGGDGGRGGHIILKGNKQLWTLIHLKYRKHIIAEDGVYGKGMNKTGREGKNQLLEVPLGTIARDYETNEIICEITDDGQEFIITPGGRGGLGNCNFKPDSLTDTLVIDKDWYFGSYYYVDDISVILIDSLPAYAGKDTAITIGDSVFIGQELSNLNCTWQKLGDSTLLTSTLSGLYVQPTSTASYIVTQTLCGTITKDTVTITVNSVTATRYAMFGNSITLYPNPTHNTFNIAVANATTAPYAITIQDAQARTLQQANYLPQQGIIHIDTPLANGVYFIHIAQGEYAVTKKIIVQH